MCNPTTVDQHPSSNGARVQHTQHTQAQAQHPHDYNYGHVRGSYAAHNTAYLSSPVHPVGQSTWQPQVKPAEKAPRVFVHDPYTLRCADDEEDEYNTTNTATETESARVFCSGKGIPTATDEEFLEHIAPVSHLVTEIFRPRGGRKEFLYVEFSDAKAADVLLSWHPMKFRGSRLNLSRAKPASRANQPQGNSNMLCTTGNTAMVRCPPAAAA